VIAEQQVAQDITAEITDSELEHVQQLIDECLGAHSAGKIGEHSAISWQGGQILVVLCVWHQDAPLRKVRYGVEFVREAPGDTWELSEVGFMGSQSLSRQDSPITFSGYLRSETVKEVVRHAASVWHATTTDPFAIAGIISNQTPPVHRGAESSETEARETVYEVAIQNLSPRELPPAEAGHYSLTIANVSTCDNTYNLRLGRDDRGCLVSTDLHCASGSACATDLFLRLRENLDRPVGSEEIDKRLQAALAALPAESRATPITNTQFMMLGATETFHVQFEERAVSQARTETFSVTCSRPTGSAGDWRCHHSIDHIRQKVPGQAQPIGLLSLPMNESDVRKLVVRLQRHLAANRDVRAGSGEMQIFSITPQDQQFQCQFRRGRDVGTAVFRYDDEVTILSVKFHFRLDEGTAILP